MASSILTDAEVIALEKCVPPDAKVRLLAAARQRFGNDILPVHGEKTIDGGFRICGNFWTFWYNRANHETHMQKEPINKHYLQEA